ncbi:EAL and HDOD domain-containing protein [Clostridium paraputrificum]|uniref:EAL and HDOD domain-containing protein n=1 Tax=Clostridium TaxID=1485 RepID=UPI003D3257D4
MDIFLARQAIYNKKHKVIGYELLFRNSNANCFNTDIDEDKATMKLISNCYTIGLNQLTNNKKAFINFSQGVLLKDIASLLAKETIVIEILENVNPTKEVKANLTELKQKGYTIALDDVIYNYKYREYGDLIDLYKVDFMNTTKEERSSIIRDIREINPNGFLLAEKIEDEDNYKEALDNGYSYFQGFYFSKPIMILGKDIPIRNTSCLNIMIELLNDEFDMDKIEAIIKSDVSISYKLMKFLNSAVFSFVQKITSIRQGIMLLGQRELKKWLSVVVISEMQSDNDEEVTSSTIIRGRFCELIGSKVNEGKQSLAFMVGLFSDLDKFIQRSMKDILLDIPVDEEVKQALLGNENELSYILRLVQDYESMNLEGIEYYSEKLDIDKRLLMDMYLDSIGWANKLIGDI